MSLKGYLVHLYCPCKAELCREALLHPEARDWPSNDRDSHRQPFVQHYLICLAEVGRVSIIIDAPHFVPLPCHAHSSPWNEDYPHNISLLYLILFFIGIPLNKLHPPATCSGFLEVLSIIEFLVPPETVIRHFSLVSRCEIHVKWEVKPTAHGLPNAINVLVCFLQGFPLPYLKEFHLWNLHHPRSFHIKAEFLINLCNGYQEINRVDVYDPYIAIDFLEFLTLFHIGA